MCYLRFRLRDFNIGHAIFGEAKEEDLIPLQNQQIGG